MDSTIRVLLDKQEKNGHCAIVLAICSSTEIPGLTLSKYLHTTELCKANSSNSKKDNNHYSLGRIAAKRALGELDSNQSHCSFAIKKGKFGEPLVDHLPGNNLAVSISHCANLGAAIAFPTEIQMGIDIEKYRGVSQRRLAAAYTVLTASERKLLWDRHPLAQTLPLMLWTMKEALAKSLKCGMSGLDTLVCKTVSYTTDNQGQVSFVNYSQFRGFYFIASRYIMSLVLPRNFLMGEQVTDQLNLFWQVIGANC